MNILISFSGETAEEVKQAMREFLGEANDPLVSDTTPAPKEPRKTRTPKETPPVPEAPPKVNDGLEDDEETFTVEQIRALGKNTAKVVGPDKVRGLIKEMGFENISVITPEKFGEFAAKVKLLK